MAEINFVRQRVKQLSQSAAKDQKYFKIMAMITGSFFIIFLILFGYKIFFTSSLNKVLATQTNVRQSIVAQENQEKNYLILINKVRVLRDIFKTRHSKQAAIEYFSQVFGPDVIVARVAYDASSELLAFNLQAPDIFTLESVMDILNSPQTMKQFATLSQSGLQRTANGAYQVQISVTLGEGDVEK